MIIIFGEKLKLVSTLEEKRRKLAIGSPLLLEVLTEWAFRPASFFLVFLLLINLLQPL